MKPLISSAIGGFGFGLIEKTFPQLPTLPILGRAGTIAVIGYMMRGKIPMALEVAKAAAVIAGYQMGATGKISGDDLDGDDEDHLAPQVRGIAAQV